MAKKQSNKFHNFEYEIGDEVYKGSPLTDRDKKRPIDPSKENTICKVLNKIEGNLQYQIIYLECDEKEPYNGYEFLPTAKTIKKAEEKAKLKDLELSKTKEVTKVKEVKTKETIENNVLDQLKFKFS